jgi:hypothetical protein
VLVVPVLLATLEGSEVDAVASTLVFTGREDAVTTRIGSGVALGADDPGFTQAKGTNNALVTSSANIHGGSFMPSLYHQRGFLTQHPCLTLQRLVATALALYHKRGFANGSAFSDDKPSQFNPFLHLELNQSPTPLL